MKPWKRWTIALLTTVAVVGLGLRWQASQRSPAAAAAAPPAAGAASAAQPVLDSKPDAVGGWTVVVLSLTSPEPVAARAEALSAKGLPAMAKRV